MKLTINKIAELAGVSRGTVDKVIHDRPGVSDKVRREVKEVIEENGYVPLHMNEKPKYRPKKIVAVILPKPDNPFFEEIIKGIDQIYQTVEKAGVLVEYYRCEETDIQGMTAVMDFLDDRKIDACLIRAVNNRELSERIKRASARGTAVFLIDSDISSVSCMAAIGEDCYKSGRIAASLMAKTIGVRGNVAVIGGFREAIAHQQRLKGFREAISDKYPGIKIIKNVYTFEQDIIAYQNTMKLIEEYPNLDGIFALAGYAGNIGKAIVDSGKKSKIKMICYNRTEDVQKLLRDGIASFALNLNPYYQGQTAMETICAYLLKGKSPGKSFIESPIEIVIDESIS